MNAAKGKTQVTLTLPVAVHEQLLELAVENDRTLAGYIRWILLEYLRKQEKDKSTDKD